jgi:hypothetical protein
VLAPTAARVAALTTSNAPFLGREVLVDRVGEGIGQGGMDTRLGQQLGFGSIANKEYLTQ